VGGLLQGAFAGPKQVLRYLSRYTHRVAISNRRLIAADGNAIAFRWKDYRSNGPGRWKTVEALGSTCSRKRLMNSCGCSRIVFQRPGRCCR